MDKKLTTGQFIFTVFYLLLWPALFLFISGDWFWIEGWIFGLWFLSTTTSIIFYMYVKDPALLAERFRKQGTGNQKTWDKIFFLAMGVFFIGWIVFIPIDSKRYLWTKDFPMVLKYIGCMFLLLSSFFLYRSFADNTFLSPLVRIQAERNQQLVTKGVYGFVRHPMYLGGLLMFVGVPLLVGSYLGLSISVFLIISLAIRAIGEEKMMLEELEGYEQYKQKVKFRFFPHVW